MSGFPLWLRVIVAALMALPLMVAVLAFVPALALSVALSKDRRDWLLEVLDRFVEWAKAIFSSTGKSDDGDNA
ncbi:hypothetical protein HNP84_009727 [Thermocatellispora tengchongensis]|uniref:Uncharacterized protein n=1 Tax=Thermocatellispora tengchongensis TaxID=1073253 RepID=A0A840PLK0_9ACTN|nr:hypothetical protein [Thermocatellispora tengchongensis]MBB5139962.1 hypothetical protein [Thermocatellispora tengchongensis]